jgi:hypothetical protein
MSHYRQSALFLPLATACLTAVLTACGAPSTAHLPPEPVSGTVTSPAPAVRVLSLTALTGAWGKTLTATGSFAAVTVQDEATFKQALAGADLPLLYADSAQLPGSGGAAAVLKLARAKGIPVLIEGDRASQGRLGALTMDAFGFQGAQAAYLVRPVAGSDGGLSVVGLNAEAVGAASVAPDRRAAWLASVLLPEVAGPVASPDAPLSAQAVPPEVWVAKKFYGNEGMVRWGNPSVTTTLATCSIAMPCTDYTYSALYRTFGQAAFTAGRWYGNWIVCGGTTVDANNHCGASYTNTTITATGTNTTKGFTVGGELNGEVSIGDGYNPFTLFSEWKAKFTFKAEYRYDKTWTESTTNWYSTTDNVTITQGYRARFGQGDYAMSYNVKMAGRHERMTNMTYVGGQANQGCRGSWDYLYEATLQCNMVFNPNFRGPIQSGVFKTFGAKVWAICKNTDLTCINAFNSPNRTVLPY